MRAKQQRCDGASDESSTSRGNCGIVGLALATTQYGDYGLSVGGIMAGMVILFYNVLSAIFMLGPRHRHLRGRADSLTGLHRFRSTAGGFGMTSERPTKALRCRQGAAAVLGTRVCHLYAPALGAPAPISCRALATFR